MIGRILRKICSMRYQTLNGTMYHTLNVVREQLLGKLRKSLLICAKLVHKSLKVSHKCNLKSRRRLGQLVRMVERAARAPAITTRGQRVAGDVILGSFSMRQVCNHNLQEVHLWAISQPWLVISRAVIRMKQLIDNHFIAVEDRPKKRLSNRDREVPEWMYSNLAQQQITMKSESSNLYHDYSVEWANKLVAVVIHLEIYWVDCKESLVSHLVKIILPLRRNPPPPMQLAKTLAWTA